MASVGFDSQPRRRLAAIMFTDMVGYTALSQRDESLSIVLLEEQRKLLRPIFSRHNGAEIKTIGDGFLVEFSNALDAIRCAYDVQRGSREFNISRPSEQRIRLRIGLHLGDVLESNGDITGDAVNIASRIQSLADDGGVCVTRQVYDQVQNKFELPLKSIGTKPLKNVRNPIEVYKMSMPWQDGRSSGSAELDMRRVAVLPFANMSPDPNDSYFADGITEEIISTLSGVSGLSVISRTSVMGYKGTTKKVKEIGTELEAGSILEGSFRKAGNRVRVTTQLIAVENDRHVWAQSYDRTLDDVFAVQSDIAKQVSDALRVKILEPELQRIERKPTENTKAYAFYLQGRSHWNKRGEADIKKAAELFKQAVREDRNFALGYGGLADCYELLAFNWGRETSANHGKAKSMIDTALRLDPNLAEAHASKGLILLHDLDVRSSEHEFKRAIELKPSYATAHQWFSQLLIAQSRWREAERELEKAVELDPMSQVIQLNYAGYFEAVKDNARALEICRKAMELDPSFAENHFELAGIYGKLKRLDDATREAKTGVALLEGAYPVVDKMVEMMIAYFENDVAKMRSLLPYFEGHVGEPLSPGAVEIAGMYMFLGETDKGFKSLEDAYLRKEFGLLLLSRNEMFDGVREDPRYRELLRRLDLQTPAASTSDSR